MQIVNLDISVKNMVPRIYAKQGDVGRKFKVVLSDNGVDYAVPNGASISVWYCGTSGEGNYTTIGDNSAIVIEGNMLTVEMVAQMLVNKGGGTMCLVLNAADGTQIGMWDVEYLTEPIPGADSTEAQVYYTAFTDNVQKAMDAAVRAEAAAAKLDLLRVYPVGSIYISVNSVSPSNLFGGVWEQIKDMFLLGCGDSYAAGASGGSAVTLHSHGLPVGIGGGYIYADSKNDIYPIHVESGSAYAVAADATEITATSRTVSDSTYLDNMPPYLAVYMWKRIA